MSISISMTIHTPAGGLLGQSKKIKGFLYEQYIQKQ